MHPAAYDWVRTTVERHDLAPASVLDLGGRNINGTARPLFPAADYVSVDIEPGPDVDVVADAASVDLGRRFDVVVSTELLEHTPSGRDVVANAHRHLAAGGVFIATMAGPGREQHSATGASTLAAGEWYRNVEPDELDEWLADAGFLTWSIDVAGPDVRCVAFTGAQR